ncbi:hypothetical protein FH972_026925 [Carpinus fangiana]|uniref:Aldehyde dehydrogenase domain-containing protein n=1 Tax=Carpinus fangiana TaxID=176857 RepID=A0A5N6L686_9ROSI|nr:hypothetical protein FH972_026925 [Carpinus fangiana]
MVETNGLRHNFAASSTIPIWLDGKEVIATDSFEVVSPLDNKVLYKCSSASDKDVTSALESAQNAFKTWRLTKPNERRDILLRAATILETRRDELWNFSNKETGAADSMFAFDHILGIEACKNTAGLIQTVQGYIPTVTNEGSSAMVLREPYGVVLAISPWNCPVVLGLRSIIGPLAMGNTVVHKGPESNPGTCWALASALHEAGLPPGCLNTIYHKTDDAARITSRLIEAREVRKVNFTGSTNTGAIIASLCGKNLKPCLMELGGKAPTIVCEDADVSAAALSCTLGAFLHGGQICMSTERIIVHEQIMTRFQEALKGAVAQVFGDHAPILIGPASVTKNRKLVQDALDKGAALVHGDLNHRAATNTSMQPVIVADVTTSMDMYYTESFGPTVSLFSVASDEEALKIANDTEYGLAAAVFTEDLRRGLRIANGIETGAVHINNMSVHDESILPHGGTKKSGFGRFNGREGLEEWVRTKVITWKD